MNPYIKHLSSALLNFAGIMAISLMLVGGITALIWPALSEPVTGAVVAVDKPAAPPALPPVVVVAQDVEETAVPVPEETPTPSPEPVMTLLGTYKIVGYNYTDAAQCGKNIADGITASGEPAVHGQTASVEGLPFGTVLYIDGYGCVTVNDRGAPAGMIDIAFDSNADCFAVTSWREVWIVEVAS